LFLHSGLQSMLSRPRLRRDFRFPSRLNPLAAAGRAIINARGKPNRRGGELLWDEHNIRITSLTPRKERVHASSQSRAGKTFDSSSARIGARGKIISDVWTGRNVRRVDENVTLRVNYVGGRESAVARGSSARQLIVSLPRLPQNHASIS